MQGLNDIEMDKETFPTMQADLASLAAFLHKAGITQLQWRRKRILEGDYNAEIRSRPLGQLDYV